MDIPTLYEDENVLVIDKPAGLVVHADGKSDIRTLADIVLEQYPEIRGVGEPLVIPQGSREPLVIDRPGIVHRLDKETSGVLVIAKNQEAFEHLKEQFKNRSVEKTYHAFVYGWLKEDGGTVSSSIARSRGDVRMWTAGTGGRGAARPAVTEYRVLRRFGTNGREFEGKGTTEDGTYSYVEFRPKTGRTHQIRVHAKYLNHPVVADSLYAPKRKPALGFKRLALHAKELAFSLPSGERKTVAAPLPPDFQEALA